jgi:hypothetical protein
MTTVVDPLGTPVPYFNKSGVAVATLSPIGTSRSEAAEIVLLAGCTVLLVSPTATDQGIKLPSGGAIGDTIEVTRIGGSHSLRVYSPDSQYLAGGDVVNGDGVINYSKAAIFRRIASDRWSMA